MVWAETPPRARGRLSARAESPGHSGDASACAGKTSEGGRGARRDGGRLRIRGEDFVSFPIHSVDRFSFFGYTAIDHSKGKLSANGTLRISPDCGIFLYWHTVLCFGELQQGYPPRVRGKPVARDGPPLTKGITPARAGKTCNAPTGGGVRLDHPRACGENVWLAVPLAAVTGSPPRMRGKHCNVEIAGKLHQITPCWKSIVAHIVRCVNKDRSPRVRGKHRPSRRHGRWY